MADVIVVNKVDSADPATVAEVISNAETVNPASHRREGVVARHP